MSTSSEYIKDNKKNYDDFKIIKNKLVIIYSDKEKEKEKEKIKRNDILLPIITNISYHDNGNVKLDNYIYKNNKSIENIAQGLTSILNKRYENIIIYKYNSNNRQQSCHILKDTDIINMISDIYNDINPDDIEEYYLKKKTENIYIGFKIFISFIIISIDNNNIIIFDYCKKSCLKINDSIKIQGANIPITKKEFENLKNIVITKAIYEDNPFDYLPNSSQS
jgi:hypothetical protein